MPSPEDMERIAAAKANLEVPDPLESLAKEELIEEVKALRVELYRLQTEAALTDQLMPKLSGGQQDKNAGFIRSCLDSVAQQVESGLLAGFRIHWDGDDVFDATLKRRVEAPQFVAVDGSLDPPDKDNDTDEG